MRFFFLSSVHFVQARNILSGLSFEVCGKEAADVVSETIAPFKNDLAKLRREKDVVAIQVLHYSNSSRKNSSNREGTARD